MQRHKLLCLIAILGLMNSTGCSWAARRTLREAKGASAEVEIINNPTANFRNMGGVQAGQPRSRLGSLMPGEFAATFPAACRKYLVEADDAPLKGSGTPLKIDSEVMWYHKRRGLGVVTGEKSYAVMLLDLASGGRQIGRLQIVATSGASRTDAADMAEAMAEELAKWIDDRSGSSD